MAHIAGGVARGLRRRHEHGLLHKGCVPCSRRFKLTPHSLQITQKIEEEPIDLQGTLLRDPVASADSFTADGWFRTGDLGQFVDAEGNLRIAGRKKEIINRAGKKYFPREIEELLYEHPKVMQAAVVGVPDPRLGESNCLCVVLKPGRQLELEEVVAFLKGRVADYKLPERMVRLDALPMTPTGKVRRSELVRQITAR